jgi:uncharacterized protein
MIRTKLLTALGLLTLSQVANAGTAPSFVPLTQSAVVGTANDTNELNSPWVVPAGITQSNLTSMDEIEGAVGQSVVRVPGLGSSASMFDMISFDATGQNIFIPHETQFGAGVTRYNIASDSSVILFQGDGQGAVGNWTNDYGAFDPSLMTPTGTLFLAEEWAGQGRVIEVTNPQAAPAAIIRRELNSIPNVAHEGLRFGSDNKTLYFVDENNSGSIYKIVFTTAGNYLAGGQTFVLKVDAYAGDATKDYSNAANVGQPRVGAATWVPLTDASGTPLTVTTPFRNGDPNLPVTDPNALGGRVAADEVTATPYGRPEDIEVGHLANGREVVYFAATSEQSVYSIEMLTSTTATVRLAASEAGTPKNVGFAGTSGVVNSPDNLAQDSYGNIYIIEDAPNNSLTGGDIWFLRDTNTDGVAESLDHFMSIRVAGSEATGMIFNPVNPRQFVVAVQHPTSTDLGVVPNGFGDALWTFSLPPVPAVPVGPVLPWALSSGLLTLGALATRLVRRRRSMA